MKWVPKAVGSPPPTRPLFLDKVGAQWGRDYKTFAVFAPVGLRLPLCAARPAVQALLAMMLATRHVQHSAMRDLEQELADTMARAYDSHGQAREGFVNLTRRMENEEEDQFDVDHTIFDFLIYKATAAVLEWQTSASRWESDLPNALITITADWRTYLTKRHHGRRLSGLAAFRSRLLQFVLLLTHRYHPSQTWTNQDSLQRLRDKNVYRCQIWQKSHSFEDLHHRSELVSDDDLKSAQEHRISALKLPAILPPGIFNDSRRPSLHELLPLFIELTAARANLGGGGDWQPATDWFDLAGQFMLQAAIDQCLIDGECKPTTMTSIFAFGSVGTEREESEGTDVTAMRSLFCRDNQSGEELPEWTAIRHQYIREVSAIRTFQNIEEQHSYTEFESKLISFLQHLHDNAIKPDLIQVEERRFNIDGVELSEAESREMYQRMRL